MIFFTSSKVEKFTEFELRMSSGVTWLGQSSGGCLLPHLGVHRGFRQYLSPFYQRRKGTGIRKNFTQSYVTKGNYEFTSEYGRFSILIISTLCLFKP